MTKFRKALLFTLCLIPFAAVGGWFTAQMSIASVDEEALANAIQQVGSKEMVMLLTTLQTVIYAVICGFLGYIVADKIGLIRPFQLAKKDTLITLLAGAICGIIVSADAFTFANWIPELADSYENSKSFDTPTWIASILYGGVIEEVMMRLFFMSLIALIGWKLFCKKEDAVPEKILVVSNITAAALFAAAHLPLNSANHRAPNSYAHFQKFSDEWCIWYLIRQILPKIRHTVCDACTYAGAYRQQKDLAYHSMR